MTDRVPTLLLTRPEPQSRAFLELCETRARRSLPSVISPVLRIEATGQVPDLDRFDTILVTSSNAVRCLSERFDLTGRHVVTVGVRTAEAARHAGAVATMLGEDAEGLVAMADRIEGRAVFCRGVHSRGDISRRLSELGVSIEEVAIYDQVEQPLTQEAIALLSSSTPVLIPLFSPRSAAILSRQAVIEAPVTVIAMSKNVAAEWTEAGRIVVSQTPTADSMCDTVIQQIRNPGIGLGGLED